MKTIKVTKAEIEAIKECHDDALSEVILVEEDGTYKNKKVAEKLQNVFMKILSGEFNTEQQ
tara:strand:+ start:55 stop:237 length:183 start_codon:yes stop_codon:yes gene_type:complete